MGGLDIFIDLGEAHRLLWVPPDAPDTKRPSKQAANPVNMPNPIRKRFGYGQLWPLLRPACSQNRTGSYVYLTDPTPRIRFVSVLPKKVRIALCKTGANPTWMAWSGFGQTYLVRKQVGEQDSPAPVLVERNRPEDSVALFHRHSGSYCAKPARIRFGSG